jgi:hypothetical protein
MKLWFSSNDSQKMMMRNSFSCSREIFSKTEAESWWTENGNRIRAMYNALPFEQTAETNEPASCSDEEEEVYLGFFVLHSLRSACLYQSQQR